MSSISVQHEFYKLKPPIAKQQSEDLFEEIKILELPYGRAELKQCIFNDIRIIHSKHIYNDRYVFQNYNEGNVVSLEFNLKGRHEIHHNGHVYQVQNQQHNIIYSPGNHNTFRNLDLETESLKVEFNPDYFQEIIRESNDILLRFQDNVELRKPVVLSPQSGRIDAQIMHALNHIRNDTYSRKMKKVFLLSKCLELLVYQAESFAKELNPVRGYLKRKNDLDKLEMARSYIANNLEDPPSLKELARISGLNEYKLKRGFKETYHNTVFGYLSEYRLQKAFQYLEKDEKTAKEIAFDLGYSSPQHFSKAFKAKFGKSPKNVRKINF